MQVFFNKNFFDIYSVTPKNFLFKKFFLETGPLISFLIFFFLIILKVFSNDSSINLFYFFVIFSKALIGSYLISIKFINLLFRLY